MLRVEQDFGRITALINVGIQRVIQAGIHPTEVWLGATEMKTLQRYTELKFLNTRRAHEVLGGMPEKIMGLEIRLSVADGVRVGVTWETIL